MRPVKCRTATFLLECRFGARTIVHPRTSIQTIRGDDSEFVKVPNNASRTASGRVTSSMLGLDARDLAPHCRAILILIRIRPGPTAQHDLALDCGRHRTATRRRTTIVKSTDVQQLLRHSDTQINPRTDGSHRPGWVSTPIAIPAAVDEFVTIAMRYCTH